MHALGTILARQRLGEGTLGKFTSSKCSEEGRTADRGGSASDEERRGVRRRVDGLEEERERLLSKDEETLAVWWSVLSVTL